MSWCLTIASQKSLLQLLIDKMSPNFSVCMQEPERCRVPAALWSSVTFTLVNDATSILVQADAVLDALFILSYCCCSVLLPLEVLCFSVFCFGFFAAVVLGLLVPLKGSLNASAHQEIWGNFILYKCNKTDLNRMEGSVFTYFKLTTFRCRKFFFTGTTNNSSWWTKANNRAAEPRGWKTPSDSGGGV